MPWHGFLGVYPFWILDIWSFLNLWVYVFLQIWESFSHSLFKYFVLLYILPSLVPGSGYMSVKYFSIVSTGP